MIFLDNNVGRRTSTIDRLNFGSNVSGLNSARIIATLRVLEFFRPARVMVYEASRITFWNYSVNVRVSLEERYACLRALSKQNDWNVRHYFLKFSGRL
jgi:hypothetical protein